MVELLHMIIIARTERDILHTVGPNLESTVVERINWQMNPDCVVGVPLTVATSILPTSIL